MRHIFQSVGLSPEEAEILSILYKDTRLKVSEIAQKTTIPRTSIYVYLKSLEKRGYISKSKKGKVTSFTPKNPERILENLESVTTQFSSVLPTLLRSMEHNGNRPEISFYDSLFGIKTIYEDMVQSSKAKDIVYVIESAETIKENLERLSNRFMIEWQKQMIRKNIITQGIVTGDAQKVFAGLSTSLRGILRDRASTVRLFSSQELLFSVNLYLVGQDKVYIFVPQKEFVMKIESTEIYQSLLTLYRIFYESAKPVFLEELLK